MMRLALLFFLLITSSNAYSQFNLGDPVGPGLIELQSTGAYEVVDARDSNSYTFRGVKLHGCTGFFTVVKDSVGNTAAFFWRYSDSVMSAWYTDAPPAKKVGDSMRVSILRLFGKPVYTSADEEGKYDLWVGHGAITYLSQTEDKITWENWLVEGFKRDRDISDEAWQLLLEGDDEYEDN